MDEAESIPQDMKLPLSCEFKPSSVEDNKVGVWSKENIKEGTTFGPYAGEKKKVSDDCDPYYSWEIKGPKGRRLFCIDASDPKKSNWMRYIKCARYYEEQNMVAMQHQKEIFYKTIKDVKADEELLCWYNIPTEAEGGLATSNSTTTQTLCQGHPEEIKVKKRGRKRKRKRKGSVEVKKFKESHTAASAPKRTTATSLKSRRLMLDQQTGATGIGRRTRSRGGVFDLTSDEDQDKTSSDEESDDDDETDVDSQVDSVDNNDQIPEEKKQKVKSSDVKNRTDSGVGDSAAGSDETALVKIKNIQPKQKKDEIMDMHEENQTRNVETISQDSINLSMTENATNDAEGNANDEMKFMDETEVDDLPELDKNSDSGETDTERSGKLAEFEDIRMPILERVAADFCVDYSMPTRSGSDNLIQTATCGESEALDHQSEIDDATANRKECDDEGKMQNMTFGSIYQQEEGDIPLNASVELDKNLNEEKNHMTSKPSNSLSGEPSCSVSKAHTASQPEMESNKIDTVSLHRKNDDLSHSGNELLPRDLSDKSIDTAAEKNAGLKMDEINTTNESSVNETMPRVHQETQDVKTCREMPSSALCDQSGEPGVGQTDISSDAGTDAADLSTGLPEGTKENVDRNLHAEKECQVQNVVSSGVQEPAKPILTGTVGNTLSDNSSNHAMTDKSPTIEGEVSEIDNGANERSDVSLKEPINLSSLSGDGGTLQEKGDEPAKPSVALFIEKPVDLTVNTADSESEAGSQHEADAMSHSTPLNLESSPQPAYLESRYERGIMNITDHDYTQRYYDFTASPAVDEASTNDVQSNMVSTVFVCDNFVESLAVSAEQMDLTVAKDTQDSEMNEVTMEMDGNNEELASKDDVKEMKIPLSEKQGEAHILKNALAGENELNRQTGGTDESSPVIADINPVCQDSVCEKTELVSSGMADLTPKKSHSTAPAVDSSVTSGDDEPLPLVTKSSDQNSLAAKDELSINVAGPEESMLNSEPVEMVVETCSTNAPGSEVSTEDNEIVQEEGSHLGKESDESLVCIQPPSEELKTGDELGSGDAVKPCEKMGDSLPMEVHEQPDQEKADAAEESSANISEAMQPHHSISEAVVPDGDKIGKETREEGKEMESLDVDGQNEQVSRQPENACESNGSGVTDEADLPPKSGLGEGTTDESATNGNNNEDEIRKTDANGEEPKIDDWNALYYQKVFLPPQLDADGNPLIYSDFREYKIDIKSDHLVRGKRRKTLYKCKLCPCTVEYPHSLKRHYFVHHVEDKYKRIPATGKTTKVAHQRERIRTRGASLKEERKRRESLLEDDKEDRDKFLTTQLHDKLGFKIRNQTEIDRNESVQSSSEKNDDAASPDSNVALDEDFENSEQSGDNKPLYPCKLCGKLLKSLKRLENHMLSHPKQAVLNCHKCSRQFICKQGLERHLLIHSGEKPYSCGHCGKKFGTIANTRRHEKLHQGYKSHTCDQCDVTFIQNTDLQRHKQNEHTVNKELQKKKKRRRRRAPKFLKGKAKRYKRLVAADLYQDSSLPMKPPGEDHMCPWCGRIFNSQTSMRKHIGHIHKKKTETESVRETWDEYTEDDQTPEGYIDTDDLKDTVPDNLSKYLDGKIQVGDTDNLSKYLDGKIQVGDSEEADKVIEEDAKIVIGTNTTNSPSVHTVVIPSESQFPKTMVSPNQEDLEKPEVPAPKSLVAIPSDAETPATTTAAATDSLPEDTHKIPPESSPDIAVVKTVTRPAKMKHTPPIRDHLQSIPQHTPRTGSSSSHQTSMVQGSPSSTGKPEFAHSQVRVTGLMNSATVKSSTPRGTGVPDNFRVQTPNPYTRPPFGGSNRPKDFSPSISRKQATPPQKIPAQHRAVPQKSPYQNAPSQPNPACKAPPPNMPRNTSIIVPTATSSNLTVLMGPGQMSHARSSMAQTLTVPRQPYTNRVPPASQAHHARSPQVFHQSRVRGQINPVARQSNTVLSNAAKPSFNNYLVGSSVGGMSVGQQSKMVSSISQAGASLHQLHPSIPIFSTASQGRFAPPVGFQPPPRQPIPGLIGKPRDAAVKSTTTTIKHVLPASQGSSTNTTTIVRHVSQPGQMPATAQPPGVVVSSPAVVSRQPSAPVLTVPTPNSSQVAHTFRHPEQTPSSRPQYRPAQDRAPTQNQNSQDRPPTQNQNSPSPSSTGQKPKVRVAGKRANLAAVIQNIRAHNPQLAQATPNSPASTHSSVNQNQSTSTTVQRSPVHTLSSDQTRSSVSVPVLTQNVVNSSASSVVVGGQAVSNAVRMVAHPVQMVPRSVQNSSSPVSVPQSYLRRMPAPSQGQAKRPTSESDSVVNLSAKRQRVDFRAEQEVNRQPSTGMMSTTGTAGQALDLRNSNSTHPPSAQRVLTNQSEGLIARAGDTLTTSNAGSAMQHPTSSLQALSAYSMGKPGTYRQPMTSAADHRGGVPQTSAGAAKQITCNVCGVLFHSIKDRSDHVIVHMAEWPYKCEFCFMLFKDVQKLMDHRARNHGMKQTLPCVVCRKEFTSKAQLQQHHATAHHNVNYAFVDPGTRMVRKQNFTDPRKGDEVVELETSAAGQAVSSVSTTTAEFYSESENESRVNQQCESVAKASSGESDEAGAKAPTKNVCTKCGRTFMDVNAFHQHIFICAVTEGASSQHSLAGKKVVSRPATVPESMKRRYTSLTVADKIRMRALQQRSGKSAFVRSFRKPIHFPRSNSKDQSTCQACGRDFHHPAKLERHMKMCPNRDELKMANVQKALKEIGKGYGAEENELLLQHRCPHCARQFTYLMSLKKHIDICTYKHEPVQLGLGISEEQAQLGIVPNTIVTSEGILMMDRSTNRGGINQKEDVSPRKPHEDIFLDANSDDFDTVRVEKLSSGRKVHIMNQKTMKLMLERKEERSLARATTKSKEAEPVNLSSEPQAGTVTLSSEPQVAMVNLSSEAQTAMVNLSSEPQAAKQSSGEDVDGAEPLSKDLTVQTQKSTDSNQESSKNCPDITGNTTQDTVMPSSPKKPRPHKTSHVTPIKTYPIRSKSLTSPPAPESNLTSMSLHASDPEQP